MFSPRRLIHTMRAGTVVIAMLAINASAQQFPNRPITVIMPFGGGTSSDIFSRAIAVEAGKILGQPIIYENKPGANSRLGIAAMQAAKPDGHTVIVAQDIHLVAHPMLNPEYKLDLDKDYVPIALLFDQPLVLITHASAPFKEMKGLVAYAKSNPGKLNFSIISGSISVFTAAMLEYTANIKFTMVPYKQPSQQLIDVLESRVDLMVTAAATVKAHLDSGKAIALAGTGSSRLTALPNLPTFREQSVPMDISIWWSVIAHGDTPKDIVAKLNNAFNEARKQPAIQKMQTDYAFVALPYSTPAEIGEKAKAQIKVMEPAIRKAGIKLE